MAYLVSAQSAERAALESGAALEPPADGQTAAPAPGEAHGAAALRLRMAQRTSATVDAADMASLFNFGPDPIPRSESSESSGSSSGSASEDGSETQAELAAAAATESRNVRAAALSAHAAPSQLQHSPRDSPGSSPEVAFAVLHAAIAKHMAAASAAMEQGVFERALEAYEEAEDLAMDCNDTAAIRLAHAGILDAKKGPRSIAVYGAPCDEVTHRTQ